MVVCWMATSCQGAQLIGTDFSSFVDVDLFCFGSCFPDAFLPRCWACITFL